MPSTYCPSGVGAGVSVGFGAGVKVSVGAGVGVTVGTAVGTGVAVGFGVGVKVSVGTGVGVAVGTAVTFALSSALLAASRIPFEENVAPLTVSIPSALCFSRIDGCKCLHAFLK